MPNGPFSWRGYALSLALIACLSGQARAQSWMDRESPLDLRRDREGSQKESEATQGRNFELTFATPLLYTSEAYRSSTDIVLSKEDDGHIIPDVSLRWSRQFARMKISASIGALVDHYFTVDEASLNAVIGAFKASLTDGKSDLFIPYVSYARIVDYDRHFRLRLDSLHDAAVGISSGVGFRKGSRIEYSDAIEPGDASLGIDLRVGARRANFRELENNFVTLTLDATYIVSNDWLLGATPKLRMRWYDDYFGEERRDLQMGVAAKAVWTPEWLLRMIPRSEISMDFSFYRNLSSNPGSSYAIWDIGPTFAVRRKF